jgi:hypothetical protein
MKYNEKNRVIVRIWPSSEDDVGHCSLELEKEKVYISLFPAPFTEEQIQSYHKANFIEKKIKSIFDERETNFIASLENDIALECNVQPSIIVCLYSLNIEEMYSKFEELSEKTRSWRLLGKSTILYYLAEKNLKNLKDEEIHNCASIVYEILMAGGLKKLVSSSKESSRHSCYLTPDTIIPTVIEAKKYELKYASYLYKGESDKETLEEQLEKHENNEVSSLDNN